MAIRWVCGVAVGVFAVCCGGCRPAGDASDIGVTLRTKGAIVAKAVAGEGVIVIRSMDGAIRCALPQTGQLRWTVGGLDFSRDPVCIVRGCVVVPYQSGLCGLRTSDGRLAWTSDEVRPSIAVTDGKMIYCLGRQVYEVDPITGSVARRFGISPSTDCRYPAVFDGALYFVAADGFFYSLDIQTGAVRWKTHVGTWKCGVPVASEKGVAFAALTGRDDGGVCLRVLDTTSGRIRWQAEVGAMNWQLPPCMNQALVVLGTERLIAFDASDGHKRWVCHPGAPVVSEIVSFGQSAFLCGLRDGTLLRVDAASGKKTSIFRSKAAIYAAPIVEGGVAFVGDLSGVFTAVTLSNSVVMWTQTGRIATSNDSYACGWRITTDRINGDQPPVSTWTNVMTR